MLWYSFALAENGGEDVYNGDWDTAAYEKAADFVKEVYAYAPSDAIGADAATVNGHFFNNETAVYTNGTWVLRCHVRSCKEVCHIKDLAGLRIEFNVSLGLNGEEN